ASQFFCSKEHEAATTENSFSMIVAGSPKCEICGAIELHPINEEFKEYLQKSNMVCVPSLVIHHTSYFPEIGMEICPSCHSRIHHANDLGLNKYRPPDGDSDKFYEKRKRTEKLEGKYSKIDQEARIFDPLRFFEGLTFYQLNVMRADAGILPEEYDNNALRKYHEKHPDAKDYMRCEKCSFEFDPQYRTTCPKCRWFFR
ncbi:MAG: hypothetical protein M1454_04525, partial [Candidatus Thermoplasmatota archaeon]|nr:hypothetical protein [Candidatus Thermoplasmatota archaeon]